MSEQDITGVFTDDTKNAYYEVYLGVHDDVKFLLDYNKLDEKRIYAFNRDNRPNNKGGQGIGAIEEVLEEQIWINDIAISMQESIQLSSKVGVTTNKDNTQSVFDYKNGAEIKLEDGEFYTPFKFDMPNVNYTQYLDVYLQNVRKKSGAVQSITGEEMKAGTPYAGQALQSANASTGYNYLREKDGQDVIWIINNLILPRMVKRINKEHVLNASYSPAQVATIDQAVVNTRILQEELDQQTIFLPEEIEEKQAEYMAEQQKKGDRRSVRVPKDYITLEKIEKKMRWRVTSDDDDVQNKINSLVAQMQSLQPEDPARVLMMNQVMELSGQSPAQFRPQTVGSPSKGLSSGNSNLESQIESVTPQATS